LPDDVAILDDCVATATGRLAPAVVGVITIIKQGGAKISDIAGTHKT
jgi:hypothetical protein